MDKELSSYMESIKADYFKFITSYRPTGTEDTAFHEKYIMEAMSEFNTRLKAESGSKYIKIVQRGSVHSFIVKEDGGKFKRGDILKAASWAAPAKNFARGNLLAGSVKGVRWAGA